jgi:dTDP-4-amino-4,6-dideoxygalactose transaminase
MRHPIPFTRPTTGAPECRSARDVLRRASIGGNGPMCRHVEARLEQITGAKFALLTPSATAAIEVGLMALGIGPGDEVVLPSFAFVGQANAVLAVGARPVFCEIDAATLNIDADDVRDRITRRTKLVMPVHYAGIACDLAAIRSVARRHGLLILEDAAQAIGATWRGRHLGTIGTVGCISFHGTKNITCGEGGVLLTNSARIADAADIAREKGTNRSAFLRGEVDKYTWVGRGGSHVMSDLLAAVLAAQLDRLQAVNRKRMTIWELYHDELRDLDEAGILQRPVVPADARHNAHAYVTVARSAALQRRLLTGLRAAGIAATFHFQPLHRSPYARRVLRLRQELPVTESIARRIVRLPLFADMTQSQARRVARTVRSICERA